MEVHVGCEIDREGQVMAWVAELPGCYARGRNLDEALEKVPLAVYEFCAWLDAHGEDLSSPGPVTIVAVEQVEVTTDLGKAESSAWFSFDRELPAGAAKLAVRAAQYARSDLLDLVPTLHDDMRGIRLEGVTRTLEQTLDHLILADVWHVIRTLPPNTTEGRDYLLRAVRDACLPLLVRAADEGDNGHMAFYPSLTRRTDPGEEWSGAKVLRRYVWHDRVHYRHLKRLNDDLQPQEMPPV